MQDATIRMILSNKVKSWLKSLPDDVREAVQDHVIITGGAITSLYLGESVNDYDLYLRNKDAAYVLALHYVKEMKRSHTQKFVDVPISVEKLEDRVKIIIKSAGAASDTENGAYQYFEGVDPENGEQSEYLAELISTLEEEAEDLRKGDKFYPKFLTANAITLSDDMQIITRFSGEPDEIHQNYDFVHCTGYYDFGNQKLHISEQALKALLDKRLYYVGSKYPLCSMIRMRKFLQRGFRISAGQILKISMQIGEFDLTNFEVLEDQLTGVDYAYFQQIIEALKERDPNAVDKTYLADLIDKLI